MDAVLQSQVEDEIERLDVIVKAAESWGKAFKKDPDTHKKIIKLEAKMARDLRKLFRDKSKEVERFINWSEYYGQINAKVSVQTVVSGDFFDGIDSDFINIVFDTLSTSIATGAQAGESIYKIALGIRSTDAIIQQLTTERIGALIGRRVDKSGTLVENPNAAYRISDKVREDVAKTIQTSITLGEDKQTVIDRLGKVIDDPKRAESIAQTETVNAYSSGLQEFARESGATGKEWQDIGATDVCSEYSDEGTVPLDYQYGGDTDGPAAHPGCRCGLRIVYKNEYDPAK